MRTVSPSRVGTARERYGAHRIAVVLGTSTSGVLAAEEAYAHRGADGALPAEFDYRRSQDLHSLAGFVRAALGLRGPSLVDLHRLRQQRPRVHGRGEPDRAPGCATPPWWAGRTRCAG